MERLNECYSKIISEKSDMLSCLSHMISTESYRMLSGWSFSLKPECLREGSRVLDLPEQTDVIIQLIFIVNIWKFKKKSFFNFFFQSDQTAQLDKEDIAVVRHVATVLEKKKKLDVNNNNNSRSGSSSSTNAEEITNEDGRVRDQEVKKKRNILDRSF